MEMILEAEEIQMDIDIREYDITGARFTSVWNNQALQLKVEGLEEKRPSVLKGDRIYASFPGEEYEYEGVVHEVKLNHVVAIFDPKFHQMYLNGLPCDVRFSYCKIPLDRSYFALLQKHTTGNYLPLLPICFFISFASPQFPYPKRNAVGHWFQPGCFLLFVASLGLLIFRLFVSFKC